jgi:hypothetical protein
MWLRIHCPRLESSKGPQNYELCRRCNWQLTTTKHHNRSRVLGGFNDCGKWLSVVISDWLFPRNSPMADPKAVNA